MLRKSAGTIEWLEFEIFQEIPDLFHGVFLRHGGYSTELFTSLNTNKSGGDDPTAVDKNREAIRKIASVPHLALGVQCHGTSIAQVKSSASIEFSACDGMITTEAGIGLLIKHADCQAAIIVDPMRRVIANIHAGWKGCVQNIYREAIAQLQGAYGCKPEDLLVGISPSLGPEASQFINYRTEFPPVLWQFQFKPDYFNLWELSRSQLTTCGILPHHIEIASLCTYANSQDFFSYRREKISGRHGTLVAFKGPP